MTFVFTKKSLYKMTEDLASKAKRVLVTLLNSLCEYGTMPKTVFFKLFDAKVLPILLYGSKLWGVKQFDCIEMVHYYFCKRYMNVGIKASNLCVIGDCGRLPMSLETRKRAIKYWLKFLKLPDEKYVKKCYNMLYHFDGVGHTNWVTNINDILFTYGLGYVWESQMIRNEKGFLNLLIQRMKDHFLIEWKDGINGNRKLYGYANFKIQFGYETFLNILKVRKFRSSYCKFRLSCHDLEINRSRFNNTERENRKCKFCKNKVEDEYHFLLICPLYSGLRKQYIPEKFFLQPNLHRFNISMSAKSETLIRQLFFFVYGSLSKNGEICVLYDFLASATSTF